MCSPTTSSVIECGAPGSTFLYIYIYIYILRARFPEGLAAVGHRDNDDGILERLQEDSVRVMLKGAPATRLVPF